MSNHKLSDVSYGLEVMLVTFGVGFLIAVAVIAIVFCVRAAKTPEV